MGKWTEGPWKYKLKNAGNGFVVFELNGDGGNLCDVYMTNLRQVAEERSRLIAAAPELAECLRELCDEVEKLANAAVGQGFAVELGSYRKARALLARLDGEA